MQTLTVNRKKIEVKVVSSQWQIIFSQTDVPTVKVRDHHYKLYIEEFDGKKIPVFRAPIANTNIFIQK